MKRLVSVEGFMGESQAVVEIRSVADLIGAATWFRRRCASDAMWWRGQLEAAWSLRASVFRRVGHGEGYETFSMVQFRDRASALADRLPAYEDVASWVFLAQHHRLPTRILDWTESALASLYFAIARHAEADEPWVDGVLWVVDPMTLNQVEMGESFIHHPSNPLVAEVLKPALYMRAPVVDRVCAIIPRHVDGRIRAQLGAFTVHGTGQPLEERESGKRALARFVVPADAKPRLRAELRVLGVSRSALFPDLDNLAADLGTNRYVEKS